jgi:hypothetical protein
MDEQERDYLRERIRELERSNRRWKLATSTLTAALAIFLIVGGLSSHLLRLRQEKMMDIERARAAEAEARLQAEQLRHVEGKALKETKEGDGAAGIQERANEDVGPRDPDQR